MARKTLKYTIERNEDGGYFVAKQVGTGLSLRFTHRQTAETYIQSVGGVVLDGQKS